MVEYSSHDWRKNTDDAVVVDTNSATLKVNDCDSQIHTSKVSEDRGS